MTKGLVLCGGGSKGSYEMGAWRALEELGYKFNIVTGTSIGCLTASMYCQHDFDSAFDLWSNLEVGMIMESGFNFENNSIRAELKKKTDFISFFSKYISNFGADIKPFYKILDKYVDESLIKNSDVKFGIVCATFPSRKPVEILANDLPYEDIKPFMCASASCFPIFPVCKIHGKSYIDGGYYDNLPINYCIHLGAEEIVAIDLNMNITHKEFLHKPHIKYVHPYHSLGSFMLFDRKVILRNIDLGYMDTMKAFGKYKGFRYTFSDEHRTLKGLRKFTLDLASDYHLKSNLGLKSIIKDEKEADVYKKLEEYTYGQELDDYDYFLRALEICGEVFDIDYYKVYKVKTFILELIDQIILTDDNEQIIDGYFLLKPSKRKEYLLKQDDKKLIRWLFNHTYAANSINIEIILDLMLSKPNIYIVYKVLNAMHSYLGDLL